MIQRNILAEVTFELLASSSMARYRRIVRAAGHAFHEQHRGADGWEAVMERARSLIETIAASAQRDVGEAELAILLDALSRTAVPDVDQLLAHAAARTEASLAWVASLARRLSVDRPTSITFGAPKLRTTNVAARSQQHVSVVNASYAA